MSQREGNLLWLRDILDHLRESQRQLEWAEGPESVNLLTESMLRDLERCQRLCKALQRKARHPAA